VHVIEKVRLLGIDTAETHGRKKGSPEWEHGMAAKRRVEELLIDKEPMGIVENTGEQLYDEDPWEVTIRTQKDKTGKYGRFLAEVILPHEDGRALADILREEGFEKKASYD
jgi:endonuclease YncB( thermonuclease family)